VKYLKTFDDRINEWIEQDGEQEVQNKVVGNILVTKKKFGTGLYQITAYSRVFTQEYKDKYNSIRTYGGHIYGRIGSEKKDKQYGKAYRFIYLYFPEAKQGEQSFGSVNIYDKSLV
jgi:hypothetical protein